MVVGSNPTTPTTGTRLDVRPPNTSEKLKVAESNIDYLTVEFHSENLKRFLWYASKQDWSDDIRMLTEWNIREFLGYLVNEKCRWGLVGNGSETSKFKAAHTTVHHCFVVLVNFFGWVVSEGFLTENPTAKIKVAKPNL
ncbi:hypothetical protein ACFLUZ_01940 [Chloroflexota bacterium]